MSNELAIPDDLEDRFRKFLQKKAPPPPAALPLLFSQSSGVASTFLIARNQGGVGAGILTMMLSLHLQQQPFIIQVGGLRSWAFEGLSDEDFCHFKTSDFEAEDWLSPPLDKRLEQPTRPAILEYPPEMPQQAVMAANMLSNELGGHAVLCVIGAAEDVNLKVAEAAANRGVRDILRFRTWRARDEHRSDVIQIPTVPAKFLRHLYQNPRDLGELIQKDLGLFATVTFYNKILAMGDRIKENMR